MQHKFIVAIAVLCTGFGAAGAVSADVRADVHPHPP